jgi:hypothetical protein
MRAEDVAVRGSRTPAHRVRSVQPEATDSTPQTTTADAPPPNGAEPSSGAPLRRPTLDSAEGGRRRHGAESGGDVRSLRLQEELDHRRHLRVIDRGFEVFDAPGGGDRDGNVSRNDLEDIASGGYDRGAAEDTLRSRGVPEGELGRRLHEIEGTARYLLQNQDRFTALETANDGDGESGADGNLRRGDLDRALIDLRATEGGPRRPTPSQEEVRDSAAAYRRMSADPDAVARDLEQNPDLRLYSNAELNALATLNAERPELRPKIREALLGSVEGATSLDDLPQNGGFQLLLDDHLIHGADDARTNAARDRLRGFVGDAVDARLDDRLTDRRGEGELELGLERFKGDLEDLATRFPVLRDDIRSTAEEAFEGAEDRFQDVARADDNWFQDAGNFVSDRLRDFGDFLGHTPLVGGVLRGAGHGLANTVQGAFELVNDPLGSGKAIIDTITHPGRIVDYYAQSAKENGADFVAGELVVEVLGLKGTGRILSNARRGLRDVGDGPDLPELPDPVEIVPRRTRRSPEPDSGSVPDPDGVGLLRGSPEFRRLSPEEQARVVDFVRNHEVETKPVEPQFRGEETGAVWGTRVKYLTPEERAQYQVSVRDGRLFDANGQPLDSTTSRSVFGDQRLIFVMSPEGRLYASGAQEVGRFHHSSFLAGGEVAGAGELVVRNGRITELTDRSGHYRPDPAQVWETLERLRRSGVDLDQVTYTSWRGTSTNAADFYRQYALQQSRRNGG